jgi:hypothetical protein
MLLAVERDGYAILAAVCAATLPAFVCLFGDTREKMIVYQRIRYLPSSFSRRLRLSVSVLGWSSAAFYQAALAGDGCPGSQFCLILVGVVFGWFELR